MGAPPVNAHEWPSGLTLTWSSLTGWWTYSAVDEYGLEVTLALPVPPLPAPSAVSAVLPPLMDGRHGQLPASEERWEHAGLLESMAESAALYGDDKYDAAYQAAEEQAENFLRWQEQLDGQGALEGPGAGLSDGGADARQAGPEGAGTPEGHTAVTPAGQNTGVPQDGGKPAGPDAAAVPADHEEPVPSPTPQDHGVGSVLLDPDGAPLPPAEEASLNLLTKMLTTCADLADEMGREPHSFAIHAEVLLAQYSRVANVGRWIGLTATALRRELLEQLGRLPSAGESPEPGDADGPTRYRVVAQPGEDTGDDQTATGRHTAEPEPEGRRQEQAEGTPAAPELIERVLNICGQHYAAVTGTSPGKWEEESREVVGIALRSVRLADRATYPQALEDYLRANRARLERLWRRYGPGGMFADEVVLVDFPACYVLCERIDNVWPWLNWVWAQEGQEDTALERLHDSWLYDTQDKDGRP